MQQRGRQITVGDQGLPMRELPAVARELGLSQSHSGDNEALTQGKVCFCGNFLRSLCLHVPYLPDTQTHGERHRDPQAPPHPETCPQTSPQISPKANVQTLHKRPTNTPTCSGVEYPYTRLHTHIHPHRYPTDTLQSLSHTPQPHTHPTDTTQTLVLTPPASSTNV